MLALVAGLLAGTFSSGPTLATSSQPSGPSELDPAFFPDTGYRVSNTFSSFFHERGGVSTFGAPLSNELVLLGLPTQIFQRHVLQVRTDGSVGTAHL
jgi:hypothetical protein